MEHAVKRLLVIAAVLGVGLLGGIGARPDAASSAPAFPPDRPTRVLVLGDSVIKGSEPAVLAALAGRDVVFDAEVNRSTGTGADIVAQRGGDWDVAVVLLGHNDGGSPGVFQPAARRILDQLRGVPYVSWLTIHEVRPYYPDVNHFIASLQPEYPNLHIGDWNAVAAAHPEALSSDGLHLNGAGADLMAGVVTEQVTAAEQERAAALRTLADATTTTAPPTTTTAAPTTSTSTTSATTTTTSPSSTTDPTADEVIKPVAEQRTTPPSNSDDDGSSTQLLVAAGTIVVLVVGGFAVWRRKRAERADQAAADTAG
jgi:lysophospholipase L1-like esterase